MSELDRDLKGYRVERITERFKSSVVKVMNDIRDHPDEFAVLVAPLVLLHFATRRHDLNAVELIAVQEVGLECGKMALRRYKDWKATPKGVNMGGIFS